MNRATTSKCLVCKVPFRGRKDKKYCSTACKSWYHRQLRVHSAKVTEEVDRILHRNHAILMECMGKRKTKLITSIMTLEKKRFNFNHYTGTRWNKEGKEYKIVYDFAYMTFSSGEVMIVSYRKE